VGIVPTAGRDRERSSPAIVVRSDYAAHPGGAGLGLPCCGACGRGGNHQPGAAVEIATRRHALQAAVTKGLPKTGHHCAGVCSADFGLVAQGTPWKRAGVRPDDYFSSSGTFRRSCV